MYYESGEQVRLGDRVKLGQDSGGVVVCVVDSGQYGPGYPESQWSYLKTGVLINFPSCGLVHYVDMDESDVELIAHASGN